MRRVTPGAEVFVGSGAKHRQAAEQEGSAGCFRPPQHKCRAGLSPKAKIRGISWGDFCKAAKVGGGTRAASLPASFATSYAAQHKAQTLLWPPLLPTHSRTVQGLQSQAFTSSADSVVQTEALSGAQASDRPVSELLSPHPASTRRQRAARKQDPGSEASGEKTKRNEWRDRWNPVFLLSEMA